MSNTYNAADIEVLSGLDLTAEYAFNHGYLTDVNEFLMTVRWRR